MEEIDNIDKNSELTGLNQITLCLENILSEGYKLLTKRKWIQRAKEKELSEGDVVTVLWLKLVAVKENIEFLFSRKMKV